MRTQAMAAEVRPIRRIAGEIGRRIRAASRMLAATPRDRWFWAGMAALLVAFIILLLTEPTGAGRGGR